MTLKILLYGINFAPELTGIGKYTGEMAAWLAAQGHQVRAVAAPPYYPDWSVGEGYSARAWRRERWQGVDVWRSPLWVPRHPGGAKRLLHLASFALSSLPVMLWQALWRPDVVWVVEPALFCAPTAGVVAKLTRAKSWLHIQDYEVDAAFNLGLIKGKRLRAGVEAVERWLMRRFDRVTTISGRMAQRAVAKGVSPARLKSFPNWVDISTITPLSAPSAYRGELGIRDEAVVALYSGNMGGKQGLEILAEVAGLMSEHSTIDFVFCGNGAGKADLVRRCQGLTNVRFLDLQPVDRLNDLLGLADIHLLPQRADAADLVMPSKLTGMLASGRAVIVTAAPGTELASVVQEQARCGLTVPPEDAVALAAAIQNLAADDARRTAMGARGRAYAKRELDREAVLRRFENDMVACVEGRKGEGAASRACASK